MSTAPLQCRRAGESIDQMPPQVVADFMERALGEAVPHVALIGWKRWLHDGWVNGSTFITKLAADASSINPESELVARGLAPGFIVVRSFAETRASLEAKPREQRKQFRWYYAEILKFERHAAGKRAFDCVDMDFHLDNWTADHRYSRD